MKNRVEIVRALIGEGAKVNVKDKDRKTPLHLAAQDGRRDVVEALCQAPDIELDLSDKEGRSALHLASLNEKPAVLTLLSEKGAMIDRKDSKKRTAFLDAAAAGNIELLKTLRACGANINQQTPLHKWSALHCCVSRGRLKCLKALLAFPGGKLDIDIVNVDGRTPLHEAVRRSRTAIVKALADKGAAVDTRDSQKRTPFLDAAKAGKLDMVKKLREKGADVDQVSGVNGWSALHEAANKNYVEVARYLVGEGAKLDLKIKGGSRKGLTARGIAQKKKNKEVLELLGEHERVEAQRGV
ncbi:ankyrin repeat protein [Paraphaeosphaeria minitans]|uniref:Ankyrin repeat protein n=1 Tax=Paraphaeosphaeria minitans TaxID=565426 RepID=A0A9P6KMX5_9PLEO|nr:ankyrin repeat protein [Paraphaeosphaeria minitans]